MKLWHSYKKRLEKNIFPETEGMQGVSYWQNRLFSNILLYLLPVSFIALVPGVTMSLIGHIPFLALYDCLAVLTFLIAGLAPGLRVNQRKTIFIACLYFLAIILFFYLGSFGPGMLYLLAITIFTSLIFPVPASYWSVLANIIICLFFGVLIQLELTNSPGVQAYSIGSWIAVSSNLIFLSIVSVAALNLLVNGLQSTIKKEERLQQQLIEKSDTLIRSLEEIKIKNLELEQFGHVAAHDLKTPIRGINMLTEWLADEYRDKLDAKGVEYLDLLRNRVTRLEGVVDGVLAYSNIGKVKLHKAAVDLAHVLEDVVADLEPDADTKIIFDHLLPNILFVRNDSYRIFYNLLENAIVHNNQKVKWIHIGYKEFPNEWHFYVQDNGPGIERQYHHKIFHIFQTLETDDDKKRTGLGLSITQKILREAGEKIWVESEPGKGTIFWFTIKK